jgi:L-asparagine transporter-like permease
MSFATILLILLWVVLLVIFGWSVLRTFRGARAGEIDEVPSWFRTLAPYLSLLFMALALWMTYTNYNQKQAGWWSPLGLLLILAPGTLGVLFKLSDSPKGWLWQCLGYLGFLLILTGFWVRH